VIWYGVAIMGITVGILRSGFRPSAPVRDLCVAFFSAGLIALLKIVMLDYRVAAKMPRIGLVALVPLLILSILFFAALASIIQYYLTKFFAALRRFRQYCKQKISAAARSLKRKFRR
jgi:hypothetical protein